MNTTQRIEGSLIVIGLASHDVHAARLARLGGQPEQVMIIDPLLDPDNPPETSASGHGKTARIPAAVTPVDGSAECSVWPALGLHSIHEPTEALQALFPGIHRRQRQQVKTVSIRTLLDRFKALPDPVRVWIDMPGSEATILEAFRDTNIVSRIKALDLRCGIEPFFEGGRSAADLIAQMAALGFNLANRDDGDPDFPDLSFEMDAQMLRVEELEAAYHERHDVAQATSRQLTEAEQELRAAFETRETLTAENQLLQEQVQGQQEEIESLLKEREENASALAEAVAAITRAGLQAEEDAETISGLKEKLGEQAQESAAVQEKLDGAEAELESLRKERNEHASALAAAREREGALTAQEAAARAQAETLTAENRLLQEQVQGQQEELETLIRARDTAQEKLEGAEAEVSRLQAELSRQAQESASAQEAAQSGSERVAALEAELETVKKERHNMWQDRDKARSELAAAQTAAKSEIEALQGQVQELRQRHSLAREELRRAEGQVELIKDLLLREAVL